MAGHPATIHRIPKRVWDGLVEKVDSLDHRVGAIEHRQRNQATLLKVSIALIPMLTAAIVSLIEALK